jgi:hypothetical protein
MGKTSLSAFLEEVIRSDSHTEGPVYLGYVELLFPFHNFILHALLLSKSCRFQQENCELRVDNTVFVTISATITAFTKQKTLFYCACYNSLDDIFLQK